MTESDTYFTELGTSERLIARHGVNMQWDTGAGAWRVWAETHWASDVTGQVVEFAKESARSWWEDVRNVEPEQRKSAFIHASRAESSRGIDAAMKLARSVLAKTPDEWDVDPFLFNTRTCTVDLQNGKVHPHCQEQLLTRVAPVAFDAKARCPLFVSFIRRIMGENDAMIAYLARLAGLFLTADISVQELYIFHGGGANGKSVLVDTLSGMMGDYAGPAAPGLLTTRMGEEHPTEIADLRGRRVVFASETEENARLKIQLVKRITGDDTLKARYMRQDYFTFRRTNKTVLITNNRPVIREATNAVWRRLRLVPFNVTIPPEEQDPRLLEKLREEWPGILNWAIRGCRDLLANGMQTPAEVMIATKEYEAEQDELSEYVADRLVRAVGVRVPRNEVWSDYQSYCTAQGIKHPMERNGFLDRIRRIAGVTEGQPRILGTPTRCFIGIGLASQNQAGGVENADWGASHE